MNAPDPKANTTTEAYLAYKAGYLEESELKPVLYEPYLHFDSWLAYWAGLTNEYPLDKNGDPEMLCDEEALVAYLSGVTDTYPEEIKDPYDVRIVGYLRHLASIRWPEPDCPVNNEEFYLSTMEPTHTSNPEPSSDIELDTAEGKIINVEAYGDTSQRTYTGKNLFNVYGVGGISGGDNPVSYTVENEELTITQVGTKGNGYVWVRLDKDKFLGKELTLSVGEVTSYDGSTGPRIRLTGQSGADIQGVSFTILPDREPTKTFSVPSELPSGVTELRLYIYVNSSNVAGQVGATSKYTKLQIEVGATATSYEPYVGGVPAPNPDYPQDVQVVTGEQTVEVTGKNLYLPIPKSTPSYGIGASYDSDTGTITLSGTGTNGWSDTFISSYTSLPAGAYTLSIDKTLPVNINLRVYYENGSTTDISIPAGSLTETKTITQEAVSLRVFLDVTKDKNLDGVNFKIQLEKGSTSTAYEPYGQSYIIDLRGKNLLNISDFAMGGLTNGNPTISDFRIQNANHPIAVQPNTTYTLSAQLVSPVQGFRVGIHEIDKKGVFLRDLGWKQLGTGAFTFTTEPDTYYLKMVGSLSTTSTNVSTGDTENTTACSTVTEFMRGCTLQLEKGTTATAYTPFTQTELCKIGDYQDYIYKGDDGWYLHKVTNKITFDGGDDETWWAETVGGVPRYYRTDVADAMTLPATNVMSPMKSNYYAPTTPANLYNAVVDYGISLNFGTAKFRVRNKDVTSIDDFKTWLDNNELKVYYPLATATDTQITDATLVGQLDALAGADTYNEKTYIKVTSNDPNLPALLKVEAYKY